MTREQEKSSGSNILIHDVDKKRHVGKYQTMTFVLSIPAALIKIDTSSFEYPD